MFHHFRAVLPLKTPPLYQSVKDIHYSLFMMKLFEPSVIITIVLNALLIKVKVSASGDKNPTKNPEITPSQIRYKDVEILKQTTPNGGKKREDALTPGKYKKSPSRKHVAFSVMDELEKTVVLQPQKLFEAVYGDADFPKGLFVNKLTNISGALNRGKRTASNYEQAAITDDITQINNNVLEETEKTTKYTSSTFSWVISPTIYGRSIGPHMRKEIASENMTKISDVKLELQFDQVPRGRKMRIHELDLNEEYLLFASLSKLIEYLQPAEFPLDLTKEAIGSHVPLHLLVFQILKMEGYVLGWILLWAILTLCLPFAVAAQLCCRKNKIQRLREDTSCDSFDVQHKHTKTALTVMLHVFLVGILFSLVLMLWSNEQISKALGTLPKASRLMVHDLDAFIHNTCTQTSFIIKSSTEKAVDAIVDTLENVTTQLGVPFRNKLADETGLDVGLSTLKEFKFTTTNISRRVNDLMKECAFARNAARALEGKLEELAKNLTLARSHCVMKDLSLCDTLQSFHFDVVFKVDDLMSDVKLDELLHIGNDFSFNNSVEDAFATFRDIPRRVALETTMQRSDMTASLYKHRGQIYESVRVLEDTSRSLSISLKANYEDFISGAVENVPSGDVWRWLTVLGTSILVFMSWGLLLCGAPCGCGQTSRMIPCLLSGISVYCVASFALWTQGSASFLFGGHGKALLCRPLYDEPHYTVLSQILDVGGILYKESGLFKTFLKGNESINVKDVVRNCHENEPAYETFKLSGILDLNKYDYASWQGFNKILNEFTIKPNYLQILRPRLQQNLHQLSVATTANLTKHRKGISGPVISKDLNTFADQLDVIAKQLSDLGSSRKIGNLARSARKIALDEMRSVVDLRDSILYELTALEILLAPFNRQINQSLSHLKTIQYFLDNQASKLAETSSREYVGKVTGYLEQLQRYVNKKVSREMNKCNPLWEVFNATRFYICRLIVDPMNGFSFSCYFCILVYVCLTPVVIKLLEIYRELDEDDDDFVSITHRRATDGSIINEQSTWTTPRAETPETEVGQIAPAERPAARTSPSLERPIYTIPPPPPRDPPSQTLLRTPSPRNATMTSTWRTRSPRRHESLRLIEQSSSQRTWRSPGLSPSPRNWI